jgi:hypothetical protein
LLAPMSGAETRRNISSGALRVKENLSDTIQSGIDKLTSKASGLEEDLLSNNNGSSMGSSIGRKQTATTTTTPRTTSATEGYGSTSGSGSTGQTKY